MTERALEEWEGEFLRVFVFSPEAQRSTRITGWLVRVGGDGIIFQPADSPRHTEYLPQPRFYPWHIVQTVERPEAQE
jgi:hypothetical protein